MSTIKINNMNLKHLNEMSLIKSDMYGLSMEQDYKKDFNKLKLVAQGIQPLKNKLYSGFDVFYLTDENNNYLGHIEYTHIDQTKIRINTTYSAQRGFCELMFKYILVNTPITMIFGDDEQSQKSIYSWKKQLFKYNKKVYNTETRKVEDFDDSKEHEYWVTTRLSHKKYLVGISESDNCVVDSYNKITDLIRWRDSRGRVSDMTLDYLVRQFDIDETDATQMIQYLDKINELKKT